MTKAHFMEHVRHLIDIEIPAWTRTLRQCGDSYRAHDPELSRRLTRLADESDDLREYLVSRTR